MAAFDPHARIITLERELAWAHLKIQSLTEELRQQRVKLLGPRSETLSDLQLELLADDEPGTTLDEVAVEADRAPLTEAPPRQRRRHPGRQRLSENLPRVEEVIPCAERTCRECGATTAVIGYDESEQLDLQPARSFVRAVKREKRACRCCQAGTVTMPPLALRIVEKGLASDRVVVETVVAKYADHLPLYRQAAILEREAGLEIGRATLDGWVMRVGESLGVVVSAMRRICCGVRICKLTKRSFRCRCTINGERITRPTCGNTENQAGKRYSTFAWDEAARVRRSSWGRGKEFCRRMGIKPTTRSVGRN